MSSKNRPRLWDVSGKTARRSRRATGAKKVDRATRIEVLIALEPRLLLANQVVTNLLDAGAGSLRQAIVDASSGTDVISFQPGLSGSINLSSGLTLSKAVTISGPGASAVSVLGGSNIRPFLVTASGVKIEALTIANGNVSGFGGGVSFATTGNLTIDNAYFANNTSGSGGGALNVSTGGTVSLTGDTFTGNLDTGAGGGAIISEFGGITVTNSTFFNNTSSGGGGGALYTHGSATGANTFLNSTIYGNHDTGAGGTAGGIWDVDFGPTGVTIRNTIVSGNTSLNAPGTPDTRGPVGDSGGNLVGGTSGVLPFLANLGGGTPTLALQPGSAAINGGLLSGAPTVDQRGVARVGAVDIGAFEADHNYYVVSSSADTGAGSFRQAITTSNATPAVGGDNVIFFSVGTGIHSIQPATPLPLVTRSALIDARTQPGYVGAPQIVLNGFSAGGTGLDLVAPSSTVTGLSLGVWGNAIQVDGSSSVIFADYLGVASDGSTALPNTTGIVVNSSSNTIGLIGAGQGNVVSGNNGNGVVLSGTGSGNVVQNNIIGLTAAGTFPTGNGGAGIVVNGASNTIGGSTSAYRNVIGSNHSNGILIQGAGAQFNLVAANYVGTDATGLVADRKSVV